MAQTWLRNAVVFLGALVFLFPFYYMVIGSLQEDPDTSVAGAFPTGGFTLDNYADINSRVNLGQSLLNSGIFTGGVLFATVVFGVLAGYALARLHFRGQGTLFAGMLLVQAVMGGLTVILKTHVVVVAIHQAMAFVFFACLVTLTVRIYSRPVTPAPARVPALGPMAASAR